MVILFAAVYSNKPVSHGISSWTLEEVYMETSHVLSGLSRKCGLHLLSPASKPVKPTVVTCHSSIGPTLELPNTDNECINLPSTSGSATCQSNVDPTSSKASDLRHEKDKHINLCDAGLLGKEERFGSKIALVDDNLGCKSVGEECLEMPSQITPAASYSSSFKEKSGTRNSELNRDVALELHGEKLVTVNPSFNCTTAQDEDRMSVLRKPDSLASFKNETTWTFDVAKDDSLYDMKLLERAEIKRLNHEACALPMSHELSTANVFPLHQKPVAKNSPATSVSENVSLPCSLESVQGSEKSEVRTPESATKSVETSESREISFESSCEESRSRKRASSNDIINHEDITSSKKSKKDATCETVAKKTRSCAANEWDKSEDLPLMANVDEVLVRHYILDLSVKFSEKVMKGSILLLIEPRNEEVTQRQFQMTLDSTLVNIESVSEVVLPDDFELKFYGKEQNGGLNPEASSSGILNGFLGNILSDKTQKPLPFKGLPYSVYGWFVRIWKPNATGKTWPRCIWIKYHTSPEGKSLTWATDQDGR